MEVKYVRTGRRPRWARRIVTASAAATTALVLGVALPASAAPSSGLSPSADAVLAAAMPGAVGGTAGVDALPDRTNETSSRAQTRESLLLQLAVGSETSPYAPVAQTRVKSPDVSALLEGEEAHDHSDEFSPDVALDGVLDEDEIAVLLAQEMDLLAQWWSMADASAEAPPPPVVGEEEEKAYLEALAAAGVHVSELNWTHPLAEGRFTSRFGYRAPIAGLTAGGLHNGVDLAAPLGYPIRAAASGTVTYVGNGSGTYGLSGWVVAVDHGDGVVTTYNHMAQAGVLVTPGQHVRVGQIIAMVGNEGRSSGPHLHFAVHLNGKAVDPVPYLLSVGVDLMSGKTVKPVPLSADYLAAQQAYRDKLKELGSAAAGSGGAGTGGTGTSPSIPGSGSTDPDPTTPPTPEPGVTPKPEPSPGPTETPDPDPSPGPTDPEVTPEPTPGPTEPGAGPSPTDPPTPPPTEPAPSPSTQTPEPPRPTSPPPEPTSSPEPSPSVTAAE